MRQLFFFPAQASLGGVVLFIVHDPFVFLTCPPTPMFVFDSPS